MKIIHEQDHTPTDRSRHAIAGATSRQEARALARKNARQEAISRGKNGNINLNAAKLNEEPDRLQQKKEEGKKRAMKMVMDAFEGQKRIDEAVQEIKDDVTRAREDLYYMRELGIEDEERESERMAQIIGGNAAVRQISLDRLKDTSMRDAQDQAEDIMDATSREVMGMIASDVRDHIEKQAEEVMEAAKERKEEKEAEEARREKIREEKEQIEAQTQNVQDDTQTTVEAPAPDQTTAIKDVTQKAQQEVRKVIEELALTDDDIKGAAVDAVR